MRMDYQTLVKNFQMIETMMGTVILTKISVNLLVMTQNPHLVIQKNIVQINLELLICMITVQIMVQQNNVSIWPQNILNGGIM